MACSRLRNLPLLLTSPSRRRSLGGAQAACPYLRVLAVEDGVLAMSALPGVNLTEAAMECAVALTAEALHLIHSVPTEGCPFRGDWVTRLHQAEHRVRCGLVDERDFDEVNLGQTATDVLAELQSLPPLPLVSRLHPRGCVPSEFPDSRRSADRHRDLGGAGVAHPAQDSGPRFAEYRNNFGPEAEQSLRNYVPQHCEDEPLSFGFSCSTSCSESVTISREG